MDSASAPGPAGPPPGPGRAGRAGWAAGLRWPGAGELRAELRADLRSSLLLTGVLTLAGLPAGLLWWALAPRAQFDVTEDGAVVVGRPSAELLVAVDSVYTLVLAGLGLLAGVLAWQLRRRRGVGTLLALAAGALLAALVAWQLGELLGPGPTEQQLTDVGARVTTGLSLASMAAVAVGPFTAVLAYVVAALLAPSEDLDRPDPEPVAPVPAIGGPPPPGGPAPVDGALPYGAPPREGAARS